MNLVDLILNPGPTLYNWFAGLLRGLSWMPDWGVTLIMNLIVVVILVAVGIMTVIVFTVFERKVIARIADRLGPNRAGPYGLFQAFADAIKMLIKEDITPANADRVVYNLAPAVIVVPALLIYAIIPFGKGMLATDLNIGILYAMSLGAITTISILMAGWSSNNKYALLGAFRSVAQLVSYEIPMALAVVSVVLLAGSMSTKTIVEAQSIPFIILTPLGFLIYFLAGAAEVGRSPFDLIEADSEIVDGFHIEYSGMKFALFFVAEYVNMFSITALATTLFLGGWQGPFVNQVPVLGVFYFIVKAIVLVYVFVWFRGTFPRLRIDHLLNFAWKFLVPLGLVNLMVVGFVDKLVSGTLLRAVAMLGANLVVMILTGAVLYAVAQKSLSKKLKRIAAG